MKIQILDLAKSDLIAGHYFYEKQEPGLGDYFLRHLYTDIDDLMITAGTHLTPYRHFHRALSKRFPFAIFYTVEDEVVKCKLLPIAAAALHGSGDTCAESDPPLQPDSSHCYLIA